jgi:Sec-independent protein translocase protein TatA
MFGWGELGLIVILAVLLLGPDKLPEVARQLGKIYAEYQKAKRRLELEILYSVEPPNKEFLDKIYEKNLSEAIKKEVEVAMGGESGDATELTGEAARENNLNIQDESHLKGDNRIEEKDLGEEEKEERGDKV